ncbi:Tethering factor for nuclear proteasome sts1 [Coemansia sp. RSA 2611]|nr:Tethering factor for nuclear proteasome sts1 [Coemansia sp. RSA 2704]KAJ2360699.1 Tethering factor for nuclear proteasome sts1 [Coemansia sp. RSA 2610]KAJ2373397.1 Tethering factor for nuclear proteasome sts1 [Coemansia sp. RSA 2611]
MSQQSHWKASALAATFSSGAGFNGTAWGAARAPLHMGSEMGFGLGFGQGAVHGDAVASGEPSTRRQKRKASSEDEAMDSSSPTPEPAARRIRSAEPRRGGSDELAAVINGSPLRRRDGRKRTRVGGAGPSEVALDKLLEPLEAKDLRALLDTLVAQNPQLGAQVRQLVPQPTVSSACSQLERLQRRLLAAFPYNKAGPAADDYTFHRVRPALEELRDTIVMYLDHFTLQGLAGGSALSHPAEWFDLLAQATAVALRMPKWARAANDAVRGDTLRHLADGWLRAVLATARWADEGHTAGRDMLTRWAQRLELVYADEPALFEPAVQAFQRSFGHLCARARA